jgi:hypothetical protein
LSFLAALQCRKSALIDNKVLSFRDNWRKGDRVSETNIKVFTTVDTLKNREFRTISPR